MANVYHGLNIRWGNGGTTSTAFGASALLQSNDAEQKVEIFKAKNQFGQDVAWVGFNPTTEVSFEYLTADGSAASGSAATTSPNTGDMITVSGNGNTLFNNTKWIVESVSTKQMNVDAEKITVKATYFPLITA